MSTSGIEQDVIPQDIRKALEIRAQAERWYETQRSFKQWLKTPEHSLCYSNLINERLGHRECDQEKADASLRRLKSIQAEKKNEHG